MKKFLLFIIFLSFLSCLKAEQLIINYYHKGTIVHSQQIEQGTAINTLPQLNLSSCDNNINIFAGWIAEEDIDNYQTANTITPTFITEEYIPTTDINLYAIFADKENPSTEFTWQQVKSTDELKNNDQIIITAHKHNYAIGKNIDKQHLIAVAITKSEDKSTITPNNDVQIFTLIETDNSLLWGINNGNGYLSNTVKKEAISTIPEIKTWSSWLFTFDPTTYKVNIRNEYTECYRYLYFHEYDDLYFACKEKTIDNLAIYKQKPSYEVNYLACTTPDAVEFTITLHNRDNTSEIKCLNDASIILPEANSNIDYWNFYGWSTEPITENTTTTPTIITSPYTPTNNIDLYAIYQATTTDSLVMNDKVVPASWTVNETIDAFSKISLYFGNYIEIPTTKDIIQIDVKMRKLIKTNLNQRLYIATDNDTLESDLTTNIHKTYSFNFKSPTTTALKFYPSSLSSEEGLRIDSIVIHQPPQYTSIPIKQEYAVLSFDKNNGTNDTLTHYSIKQIKGGNITLPNNAFTHPNKDFLCWNTQIDGSGIEYENQSIVKNITQDMTLYAQWGIKIIVKTNETFNSTDEPEIDYLVIETDETGNTGTIITPNNNNLHISKTITIEKTIDGSRYYFFSLPFDCPITNIKAIDNQNNLLTYAENSTTGDYVICYYNQELAANNAGNSTNKAWVEIINPNHILKANQGYIIGYFGNANEKITVKFKSNQNQTITSPQNKTLDFGDNYSWYTEGNNLSSNGWNLIGYPYYQPIQECSLTNFVTIPNNDGKTYTQCTYQEALNSNKITPFCSFFVQLDKNNPPTFTINENISLFSNENIQEKIVINVSNNKYSDYTTIINNEKNTKNYEIGYDLKKWIGYADNPQIYTIENDILLAFNSQNIDNTTKLSLGLYAPTEGEYTFNSIQSYCDIFLTDKKNNTTINLSKQQYTTRLEKGIYNDRFEICFQNITSNEINFSQSKINFFIKNGLIYFENIPQNAIIYLYDSTGKLISTSNSNYYQLQIKGVYHIVIIKENIKIDNFDVIY